MSDHLNLIYIYNPLSAIPILARHVLHKLKRWALKMSVFSYRTGGDFNSCLREQGIKFTSSVPYSPESNGLTENFNKVLFARVRYLLDHSE
jgi:hypothetical protein